MAMTRPERKAEFDRLFESIDGNNKTRVKTVAAILFCKPGTVRIWCMQEPPRLITEKDLQILRDGIARLKQKSSQ